MSGARTRASNRWTPRGYYRPSWPFSRCSKSTVDLPLRFPCHCVHVHCLTVLGDGTRVRWLILAVQRVPHVRCGPHDTHLSTRPFHFTPSNHGHAIAVVPRYGTCPTMTCGDPSRVTQWRSKPLHTMEIQAASHNGDPKPGHTMEIQAGSHNGDPSRFTPSRFTQWRSKPVHTKPVHTMEIQAGSHSGGSSRFTQWRSRPVHTVEVQAASHNGDPKPGHTMEIQAGSHNGDPSRFTQWRSKPLHTKPVHTMEIQASSHSGGSSRFTQWRSKPVHTMEIQISSQEFSGNPFQITWPLSSFGLYLQQKLRLAR